MLLDQDRAIVDSAVICEYLEETWPERRLLGVDPVDRAEVRRLGRVDQKFLREVTDLIWREKALKFVTDREPPNSAAVRVGSATCTPISPTSATCSSNATGWPGSTSAWPTSPPALTFRCSTISATCPGRTMRRPSCGTPG